MLTFKGYSPDECRLYTGYIVLRDGQRIGFIEIGGFFRKNAGTALTEDEKSAIRNGCKKVYEMPSEYGCLGVGESPTKPFDESRCGV